MRRLLYFICSLWGFVCIPLVASAIEYGGLGGLPAYPDPKNPRTKSIFVYILNPGEEKQDGVRIVNNSDKPKTIEVYATDSEIASGGSFACKQKVDAKNQVGDWIKLDKTELTLGPISSEVVRFTITTPDQVSVGEHNGCIVIQEKTEEHQAEENGVQLSFRSALRVAVTIPGDIHKDIEFSDITITEQPSKYIISAYLLNKGNVSLDTSVKIYIKNWFDKTIYQNGGVYPLLTQKDPMELNFEFPKPFWGGLFKVLGTAEYNGDITSQLGASETSTVRRSGPTKYIFIFPHITALAIEILVCVVLLYLTWRLVRRYKNRKVVARTWSAHTAKKGDTVITLAKQYQTTWKSIVRVNKLKPPYILNPGDTIKLPAKKSQDH